MLLFGTTDTKKAAREARRRARIQTKRKHQTVLRISLVLFCGFGLSVFVWSISSLDSMRAMLSSVSERSKHRGLRPFEQPLAHSSPRAPLNSSITSPQQNYTIPDTALSNLTMGTSRLGTDEELGSMSQNNDTNANSATDTLEKNATVQMQVPSSIGYATNSALNTKPNVTDAQHQTETSSMPTTAAGLNSPVKHYETRQVSIVTVEPSETSPNKSLLVLPVDQMVSPQQSEAHIGGSEQVEVNTEIAEDPKAETEAGVDYWDEEEEDSLSDEEGGTGPIITLQKTG